MRSTRRHQDGPTTRMRTRYPMTHLQDPPRTGVTVCGTPPTKAVQALRLRYEVENRTSARRLVLNPGEGTTGTTSLDEFAQCCGLATCKGGMQEIRILRTAPELWPQLNFSDELQCDFASDTPHAYDWPYVLATFPNAFVVHTTRDATAWVRSRKTKRERSPRPFSWAFQRGIKMGEFRRPDPMRMRNADVFIDGLMRASRVQAVP